jgi:hypothetical protein
MLFCLFLPFLEVMLQTYIKMLDQYSNTNEESATTVSDGDASKDCAKTLRDGCVMYKRINFKV